MESGKLEVECQEGDAIGFLSAGKWPRHKTQAQAQAKMSPSQDEPRQDRVGKAIGAGQDRRFDTEAKKGDPVFKLKLQYMFGIKRRHRAYLFLSAQRVAGTRNDGDEG